MSILEMQNWKNPYISVFPNGLRLTGDEAIFPVAELLSRLSSLPLTSWPHGRVVVITLGGMHSEAEIEATWKQAIEVLKGQGIDITEYQVE
jgi:hypothetical protein